MSAPSPFLRRLQENEDNITDVLIDELVGLSDGDLTELLLAYTTSPADTPKHACDSLFALAMTHDLPAHWLSVAIKARVLDRWLEENA